MSYFPEGSKRRFTTALVVFGAVALFVFCSRDERLHKSASAAPSPTSPSSRTYPRTISVEGSARLEVQPDEVVVTITLERNGATPKQAVAALKRSRTALRAALKVASVPDSAVAMSFMAIRPEYRRYPQEGILHYVASLTVAAKASPPDRVTDLFTAAASVGAKRIHSKFQASRMEARKERVRGMALKAARKKVAQIASTMGVTVGDVVSIREGSAFSGRSHWWQRESVMNVVQSQTRPGTGSSQSMPDTIPLNMTIHVTYAIK